MPAVWPRGALALALLAASGCAATIPHDPPATNDGAATPCTAADSTTRSRAIAGQFVGNYRLTMVATSGTRTGSSVTGTLALDGHAGHASIALARVGAIAAGDIGSRDPNRPGVLLVRSPNDSSGTPMFRFGADANRSDLRPFDGAYLIMLVDASTAAGFSGRWRSGVGTATSGGYYCADRVA
jgi:hypothetical protein